jgi:hypothetical protein
MEYANDAAHIEPVVNRSWEERLLEGESKSSICDNVTPKCEKMFHTETATTGCLANSIFIINLPCYLMADSALGLLCSNMGGVT